VSDKAVDHPKEQTAQQSGRQASLRLRYVTRLGASALEELLAQLPADQPPELWDRTQVMETVREGKRYVIASGPARPTTVEPP
jgi:hypothetical protein